MKKFVVMFGIVFAAIGVVLTLSILALSWSLGWRPQGALATGIATLVAAPSAIVGRAIGLGNRTSPLLWDCWMLGFNATWSFGLGALTGVLAWRLRKSPLIARVFVAAGLAACCLVMVINLPGRFTGPTSENCINNLRQIEGAKHQWALEHHKPTNDTPTWEELAPYLKTGLSCPEGGAYRIGRVDQLTSCSLPQHDAFWKQANQRLE